MWRSIEEESTVYDKTLEEPARRTWPDLAVVCRQHPPAPLHSDPTSQLWQVGGFEVS